MIRLLFEDLLSRFALGVIDVSPASDVLLASTFDDLMTCALQGLASCLGCEPFCLVIRFKFV
jgi:hypothetical protein